MALIQMPSLPELGPLLVDLLVALCGKRLEQVLLSDDEEQHNAIPLDIAQICVRHPEVAQHMFDHPAAFFEVLEDSLLAAQECVLETHPLQAQMVPKAFLHARPVSMPPTASLAKEPSGHLPIGKLGSQQAGMLLVAQGTVIRTGAVRMVLMQHVYQCPACGFRFALPVSGGQALMEVPDSCPNGPQCTGTDFTQLPDIYTHFQEIRVQEKMKCLAMGALPAAITVELKHDLAEACQPGDDVEVVGILHSRPGPALPGQPLWYDLVLEGRSLRVTSRGRAQAAGRATGGGWQAQLAHSQFEQFWQRHEGRPLAGRNRIVASFCPQVHGLFLVKLATMLTLLGGVRRVDPNGSAIRGEIHLLLVGDPGTGKSQVLKFAARVSPRSVVTTGKGSSGAGLTVSAVRSGGGQWALEAGALVLADGGLCCIDEFDGIKEADRTMLHEAMEQQTLHVAKAGMVTTLSAQTSVLGVMNPPRGRYQAGVPLEEQLGIGAPLLSRFDVVLLLLDKRSSDWDRVVAGHVIAAHMPAADSAQAAWGTQQAQATSWPIAALTEYVKWAKAFEPVMSEPAEAVLLAYYQRLRHAEGRSAARTTIRALESLVRIAQAHARLLARHTVELQDAVVAVVLAEASQERSDVLPADALSSSFVEDPDQAYEQQEEAVLLALRLQHLAGSGAWEGRGSGWEAGDGVSSDFE